MMGPRRLVAGLILGSAAAFVSISPARADGIVVEPVTFPAPFFEAPGPGETAYRLDNVLEASGVEPIGDGRLLLVAHDKKVPLRVIETATGRQVGPLLTCERFPAETPKSSKWEGMARDSEGNYYRIAQGNGSPVLADKVWTFEAAMKAEGLCVLPQAAGVTDPGTVRLVVTYDNDPHATHIPSRFQQVNLIRRPAATLAP